MGMQKSWRKQKGFTLIEALIIFIIVAVVLAVAFGIYTSINRKSSTQTAQKGLMTLASTAKQLGETSANYSGLSNSVIIAANDVPAGFKHDTSGNIYDPWNGAVTVGPAASSSTQFSVEFDGVPQSACMSLLTASAGEGASWVSVTVNGTALSLSTNNWLSQATSNCTAGNTNAIIWAGN